MTQNKNTTEKIIFALIYSFCCMLMSSDKLPFLFGSASSFFIYYKLVVCFVSTFIATISFSNIMDYIGKYVLINNLVITALFTFDYYVTEISGSQFLFRVWWIMAIVMSSIGVLFGAIINKDKCDFALFIKRFMISIAPLYMVTFIICFLREPNGYCTINLKLFNGTFTLIESMKRNRLADFEAPLIFLGNIFIFTPVPIIIKGVWNKMKPAYLLSIGFILPLFAEGYQYIFKCGNVDIDDIVMNWAGYGIGLILMCVITKYLLNLKDNR